MKSTQMLQKPYHIAITIRPSEGIQARTFTTPEATTTPTPTSTPPPG